MGDHRLSIVVPAFNEEQTVAIHGSTGRAGDILPALPDQPVSHIAE
jgi:hypothetical protein